MEWIYSLNVNSILASALVTSSADFFCTFLIRVNFVFRSTAVARAHWWFFANNSINFPVTGPFFGINNLWTRFDTYSSGI